MFMLVSVVPLSFSLKVHQIDAFDFQMCNIFFRGECPQSAHQPHEILWETLGTISISTLERYHSNNDSIPS